jgi:hypothetical protein
MGRVGTAGGDKKARPVTSHEVPGAKPALEPAEEDRMNDEHDVARAALEHCLRQAIDELWKELRLLLEYRRGGR